MPTAQWIHHQMRYFYHTWVLRILHTSPVPILFQGTLNLHNLASGALEETEELVNKDWTILTQIHNLFSEGWLNPSSLTVLIIKTRNTTKISDNHCDTMLTLVWRIRLLTIMENHRYINYFFT